MTKKILSILLILIFSLSLIPTHSGASAEAPGKGDTAIMGYTSREGTGLQMALGSTVWLPQLHLDIYSGVPHYEWQFKIDGEIQLKGDFEDGRWDKIEYELPERHCDVEIVIGHHTYHFSVIVTTNLEDTDEIDSGPAMVEIPEFKLSQLKWIHVLYGAVNASAAIVASYFIIKFKESEKWGDLTA